MNTKTLDLYRKWREWLNRLVWRGTASFGDDLDIWRTARMAAVGGHRPCTRDSVHVVDDHAEVPKKMPDYPYTPCFDCGQRMLAARHHCPHCGADQRDDIPF